MHCIFVRMKIFLADKIKALDSFTIQEQQISSWDLMERAAEKLAEYFIKKYNTSFQVHIFCGKGNNGGDGLALARILKEKNYHVKVFVINHTEKCSSDFDINLKKLEKSNVEFINTIADFKMQMDLNTIAIDALLGTGISKPVEGLLKEVIQTINKHYKNIISIDVPSGLFIDKMNDRDHAVVNATHTLTFQFPKLSFLFPENYKFTGDIQILDIGLSDNYIQSTASDFLAIDKLIIQSFLKKRNKVGSKWDFGHCLLICGSKLMPGAANIAVKSALKSGCGMVTLHSVNNVISTTAYQSNECILSEDKNENFISDIPDLKKYQSIGVGCGIGVNDNTLHALQQLLSHKNQSQKLVIDADALNLLAINQQLLNLLPKNTILTPHVKEFDRMFGTSENHYERLQKAKLIAKEKQVIIVLKSAYTAVVLPSESVYFNIHSEAALAKGGSGDMLTGLIVGLLARGYNEQDACLLAVYLHSLSAHFASQELNQESVLPTDILAFIHAAFNFLYN